MQNSEVLALIRLVRVIAGDRIFPFPALNLEKTSSVARSIIILTKTVWTTPISKLLQSASIQGKFTCR